MSLEEKVQVLEDKVKLLEALVESQGKLISSQPYIGIIGQHTTAGSYCIKCGIMAELIASPSTVTGSSGDIGIINS